MPPHRDSDENPLVRSVASALFWCGAFAFACAFFLPAIKPFRGLPPTPAVSIGRVTIDGVSKARDYAGAALFYLMVPLLTVVLRRGGERLHRRLLRRIGGRVSPGLYVATAAAFTFPFLLAPFFFLTTRRELWGILLPPALASGAVALMVLFASRRDFRQLARPEIRPFHWLILFEAAAWILFRYLATGKRIAHIPTLFLEVVFVAFFLTMFWLVALFIGKIFFFWSGRDVGETMAAFAIGCLPLLLLPFAGLTRTPVLLVVAIIFPVVAITATVAVLRRTRWSPQRVWSICVFAAAPLLIFCLTYASTAHASPWFDVFHRGESIGPASDYLRGKIPYRDVFVLHGMLENGVLDAFLMKWFGRDLEVALARQVVISAITMPMLWIIAGIALRSLPLAALTVLLGLVIAADNQRALPELLAVTALMVAIRNRSGTAVAIAGAISGFAIFYSLDMGLYSTIGGLLATVLLGWFNRRPAWPVLFIGGVLVGAAPFVAYLASHGAADDFFRNSFIVVPSIIDASWSVPFPDLAAPFRDFSVRTVADFLFTDKFRFILNPLILGVAATYVIHRFVRTRAAGFTVREQALLTLLIFGILTQRSALGRADFPHQYFSAFLIPPILAILVGTAGEVIREIWRGRSVAHRIAIAAVIGAAVPVVFTALWMPDLLNSRLDATTSYRQRLRGGTFDVRGAQLTERLQSVRSMVQRITRREDHIFDFSNQPAIYFFVDRMNPTRFYQTPILSPIDHQMEAIRDLARHRPKLILRNSPEGFDFFDGISNETRAAAVAAFIDDHYAFFRNVRGIELWKPLKREVADLDSYRRMFILPRLPGGAPSQRMVFPSFGAVAGIDVPDWRSDLVVTNPHTVPIEMRARYRWQQETFERSIKLPPKGEAVFDDAVRSLFNAPERKGGMMWVEFPADRRPLIRVATYPDSRRSSASISTPLFEPESATGFTIHNSLTIAGIKEGEGARVDLGVISTGPAPAEFLISATGAGGKPAGISRRGIAEEDGLYVMTDVRHELQLDPYEPFTMHVKMLNGTTIGYAAIVSQANYTQQILPAVPTHTP